MNEYDEATGWPHLRAPAAGQRRPGAGGHGRVPGQPGNRPGGYPGLTGTFVYPLFTRGGPHPPPRYQQKAPPLRGFLVIGAPRFELGTSSPPDFSAEWRQVRGGGGTWLRYAKTVHT
jgi:hypothetical protein